MRTEKKYLAVHTSYHSCYTRGCLLGRAWRRVGDVYADNHRVRVEPILVSKFMIDSTKLEVDLQSNVRKVRSCSRLEFFMFKPHAYGANATVDVAKLLNQIVSAGVTVWQDDDEKLRSLAFTEIKVFFQIIFVHIAYCDCPLRTGIIHIFFTKGIPKGFDETDNGTVERSFLPLQVLMM